MNTQSFPATPWQQDMWLEWQRNTKSTAYNIALTYKIEGPINHQALKLALHDLVNKHYDAMRIHFKLKNNELLQLIAKQIKTSITQHDLRTSNNSQKNIEELTNSILQKPFDLYQSPLFRCDLLKIDSKTNILVFCLHHIIIDGPSYTQVFMRAFADLYNHHAYKTPKPIPINKQMTEYMQQDYCSHQNKNEDRDIKYWLELLKDKNLHLEIPLKKRFKQKKDQGKDLNFNFTKTDTDLLKKRAATLHTTPFILLSSIYTAFLARYCNQKTVALYYPANMRPKKSNETIPGCFINNIPMVAEIPPDACLSDITKQLTQQRKKSKQHQTVPFTEIIRILRQHNPKLPQNIFSALIVESNLLLEPINFKNLRVTSLRPKTFTLPFEFGLSYQIGEQMRFRIDYTANFDSRLITLMVKNFKTFLRASIKTPTKNIFSLPLVAPAELKKTIINWNANEKSFDNKKILHRLFEQQASKTPYDIAIVNNEKQITYQQLNQKANQLAHHILDHHKEQYGCSIRNNTGIACYCDRSIEMIIIMLGILKTGASYIPIDTTVPINRVTHILTDSQCKIVITKQNLFTKITQANYPNEKIINIDTNKEIYKHAKNNISNINDATSTAYTIYTSGSTGKPKGVNLPHLTISNLIAWQSNQRKSINKSRLTQMASPGFDVSIQEIFYSLLNGNELHIIPDSMKTELTQLTQYITTAKITEIFLPTALLSYFCKSYLQRKASKNLLLLENIFVAGEALKITQSIKQFFKTFPHVKLHNHYGPTETHVATCDTLTSKRIIKSSNYSSIGRSIDNTKVYVLNDNLQPAPIGVPGELYISGAGVAAEYTNNPVLTKKTFLNNPFIETKNEENNFHKKLYKTGDKVRWLTDGNLEFIGRGDNQIKLRGFRIELGEIESQLTTHHAITQCAVTYDKDHGQLFAYYTTNQKISIEEIKKYLADILPQYMLPSVFTEVSKIQLTINGKIDRELLPTTPYTAKETSDNFRVPQTMLEKQLSKLWSETLKVKNISIDDDFFALGGHSLLMVQLLLKINQTISSDFSFQDVLNNLTIASMAKTISQLKDKQSIKPSNQLVDLCSETFLDGSITIPTKIHQLNKKPKHIFFTGATGFVGVFLLAELLQQTKATIYCLGRSSTEHNLFKKIQETMRFYKLWDIKYTSRIIPIIGDLEKPYLGIKKTLYNTLAIKIETIYHTAAYVHHVSTYSQLKSANVHGTHEIIRLASTKKLKNIHHISTVGIFTPQDNIVNENSLIDKEKHPTTSGYTSSKWIAENILMLAKNKGVPCNIYRLGRIIGHSKTGACNPDDLFYRFNRSCIESGYFYRDRQLNTDLTPVDFATKAIFYLSTNTTNEIFHIMSPKCFPLSVGLEDKKINGIELQETSVTEWLNIVEQSAQTDNPLPITPYLPLFRNLINTHSATNKNKLLDVTFDNQQTEKPLYKANISCPKINTIIFDRYIEFIAKNCSNSAIETI